jgi:hypothetical protein
MPDAYRGARPLLQPVNKPRLCWDIGALRTSAIMQSGSIAGPSTVQSERHAEPSSRSWAVPPSPAVDSAAA